MSKGKRSLPINCTCVKCGKPIFENDKYDWVKQKNGGYIFIHSECFNELLTKKEK